jgi:maltose O-acetyltransferase
MLKQIHLHILKIKAKLVFHQWINVYGKFVVENPRNVKIGKACAINFQVYILGRQSITIGDNVTLSAGCMLLDAGLELNGYCNTNNMPHTEGAIRIEDGVWIGAGAIILQGVTIGRKSVVGAGSVVTRDVPPFTVVAGNPARPIGTTKDRLPTN